MTDKSEGAVGQMTDQKATSLDPVRQLIKNRQKETGMSFKKLGQLIGKNETYVQQFITKKSPKELHDDDRKILAQALGIPEHLMRVSPPRAKPESLKDGRFSAAGTMIPVFRETEEIDMEHVTDWTQTPGISAASSASFALWVTMPHENGRVRPGDMIYVRSNQPPRVGDIVVAMKDNRVAAIGELAGTGETTTTLHDGPQRRRLDNDHQFLKVTLIALP